MNKLVARNDIVLVKQFEESKEEKKTEAGVIIPMTSQGSIWAKGEILSIGEKCNDGLNEEDKIKVGDTAVYLGNSGRVIDECVSLRESDIFYIELPDTDAPESSTI